MRSYTFLVFLFLVFVTSGILLGQSSVRKGFKFGIELKNYLSEETGTFQNTFDYSLGGFTGVNLISSSSGDLLLNIELNYLGIHYFKRTRYLSFDPFNGYDYTVMDEKYSFGIMEFEAIPAYLFTINQKISLDFFVGPGFGLGNKGLKTRYVGGKRFDYDPYDEYPQGVSVLLSMNFGLTFYYQAAIIEIRYKYANIQTSSSESHNQTNIYFQLGVTL